MRLLLHWLLSAIALLIVAYFVPGFVLTGLVAALIAAAVVGLLNATIGALLKIVTFPLTILTLGIFWFIINALILEMASAVVPGFHIRSFGAAFIGAVVLAIVNMIFRSLTPRERRSAD
ncbi:MAG: phage holin family protein [Terriglobales bacterium]